MHWTYADLMALPEDVYETLVDWINDTLTADHAHR
jgi:hypothetical protein